MASNERNIIEALRAHESGLGCPLPEKQKENIIYGRRNEPENKNPIDAEKFREGFLQALKDHPVDWFIERT